MPSGPKKRKAAKRKHHKMGGDNHHQQQDSPTSPNPSSLLPLIQPQGNGREKRPVVVEDECEETFETPRFQPETPRFPPETPYYSMESIKMGRIDEIIVPSEVSVDLVGENSMGLGLEIPSNDEESLKEMKLEAYENSSASEDAEGLKEKKLEESENSSASEDAEGLKETKLEESENSSASEDAEGLKETKLEESDKSNNASEDGEGLKEMKLDESVGVTEEEPSTEKEVELEKSEIEDKSVAVLDEETSPNASTRPVDVSLSNEKEAKVVPWSDEEIPAFNGAVSGDVEVVPSERSGDGDRIVESESQEAKGLEETTVENWGAEKEHPIPVTENSNNIVESVRETLPQINVDLINNKLDKTVEKSSLTVESSDLITEEAAQGSKALHENLESVVGATPVLSHVRVKEATSWSLDAEKVDIAQRKEVAPGPAVVRRATIWNCCGLLEVLTSSDK